MRFELEDPKSEKFAVSLGLTSELMMPLLRWSYELDGDRLFDIKVETGYSTKKIEQKLMNSRIAQAIPLSSRVDTESGFVYERLMCESLEAVQKITVPVRAHWVRVLLSELTRVSAHFFYFYKIFSSIEHETPARYFLREREIVLDLLELASGSRYHHSVCVLGGIKLDITEGFIERLKLACSEIQNRLLQYRESFFTHDMFVSALRDLCVVGREKMDFFQIYGPNARASGAVLDLRLAESLEPSSPYSVVSFRPAVLQGDSGGVFSRVWVRFLEVQESIRLLNLWCERIPSGEVWNRAFDENKGFLFDSFYYREIEGPRGPIGLLLQTELGKSTPKLVQWFTPSCRVIERLPEILSGLRLEEARVAVESFGMSVQEIDK